MRVLHVASEVAPYSKTGGLADVLGALPRALARLGCDVTVVTPRYRSIDPERHALARRAEALRVTVGTTSFEVALLEAAGEPRVWLVDHPASYDRDGIYGPPTGGEFDDNAWRFALLGAAALAAARALDVWPDVLHGHDWQAGAALLYARQAGFRAPPRTIFTVHNLAYQGRFDPSVIEPLGLPPELFSPAGYEFYGTVSLLKAGLVVADRITAVSPRYAREIQTEEQGVGLDGLLRARAARVVGILNGADYEVWSPEIDPLLPARYSADDLSGKRTCKAALQRELGLPERARTPLCGSISRLTDQKGFDLVATALTRLLADDVDLQYVVLGTGDAAIEQALAALAAAHPRKLAVRVAYDEALAHRIEAGCDLYVMPSRYEPCGLNQIYSLRYGTVPIVRATGGLDDTVVDHDPPGHPGTGFKFAAYDPGALEAAWRRALALYAAADDFAALVQRAMAQDFSWAASARRYLALYRELLG
jgi:starch synthase